MNNHSEFQSLKYSNPRSSLQRSARLSHKADQKHLLVLPSAKRQFMIDSIPYSYRYWEELGPNYSHLVHWGWKCFLAGKEESHALHILSEKVELKITCFVSLIVLTDRTRISGISLAACNMTRFWLLNSQGGHEQAFCLLLPCVIKLHTVYSAQSHPISTKLNENICF